MPEDNDFKERVLAKLVERRTNPSCEVCGNNNWAVADHPMAVPIAASFQMPRLPPVHMPCAALICNNCGNVRLFALGTLGILPGQPKEDPK